MVLKDGCGIGNYKSLVLLKVVSDSQKFKCQNQTFE